MNNYHLFLIRSDYVTQIAAHLAAGIVALALISSVLAPEHAVMPEATRDVPAVGATLPQGTTVLAASGSGPR